VLGFLRELEPDFAVLQLQIGREWPSAFGDEVIEEIGFPRCQQFLRLLFWNLAAEDRFAHSEFARGSGRLRTFTNIAVFGLKNLTAALGTCAE